MRYPVQSWVALPENERVTRNCEPLFFFSAHNLHTTNIVGESVHKMIHKTILLIENEIIQKDTQREDCFYVLIRT
ncbi:hypothetical protein EZS27_020671 [termite gut metagenome]|uniref:Uncharacterized protein n=1 Tax=termite gut metagenome TaxID=433724 RepID=A0A5J4R9K2_9ZZZZ